MLLFVILIFIIITGEKVITAGDIICPTSVVNPELIIARTTSRNVKLAFLWMPWVLSQNLKKSYFTLPKDSMKNE